jgi:hypothetical protein
MLPARCLARRPLAGPSFFAAAPRAEPDDLCPESSSPCGAAVASSTRPGEGHTRASRPDAPRRPDVHRPERSEADRRNPEARVPQRWIATNAIGAKRANCAPGYTVESTVFDAPCPRSPRWACPLHSHSSASPAACRTTSARCAPSLRPARRAACALEVGQAPGLCAILASACRRPETARATSVALRVAGVAMPLGVCAASALVRRYVWARPGDAPTHPIAGVSRRASRQGRSRSERRGRGPARVSPAAVVWAVATTFVVPAVRHGSECAVQFFSNLLALERAVRKVRLPSAQPYVSKSFESVFSGCNGSRTTPTVATHGF